MRSLDAAVERRDCGTGAGGFKPGNKCAGGGDGGGDGAGGGSGSSGDVEGSIPAGGDAGVSGSGSKTPKTPEEHFASVKAKLGSSLNVRDEGTEIVRQHISDLDAVSSGVSKAVADKGVTVHLGNSPMTELNGNTDMKGQSPRGWPPGVTWDEVPGAFNPAHNAVSAGKGAHGSASVVLHEYGHAIGHNFGIDSSPEWQSIHASVHNNLSPYLQQGGPGGFAGRQELWAESFAVHQKHGADVAEKAFGKPVRDFIDRFVESHLSVDDIEIDVPQKPKKRR